MTLVRQDGAFDTSELHVDPSIKKGTIAISRPKYPFKFTKNVRDGTSATCDFFDMALIIFRE
jgi:hypothetical protein